VEKEGRTVKASSRRGRLIIKIRWREKKWNGGITARESEILSETKLYRFLREMFPEAQKWQIRSAIRSMGYGRETAVVRTEQVAYRGRHDFAIHDEAFKESYGE
jgi:hypothetical protein